MLSVRQNETIARLVFFVSFAAVAFFYLSRVNGVWFITPDSTEYVEGARSIASGRGYVDILGHPITFFPPGTSFAYLVAALMQGHDYLYFNLTTKLMLLGYLAFAYLFLEKALGWALALFAFFLLSFSIVPLHESARILSDIPYAFLVLVTFFFFDPIRLENATLLQALFLGLLLTLSYFVRTEALYLFCGYFLYIFFCVKKDRKRILITISCFFLTGVFLWWVRNAQYHSETSYMILLQKNPWVSDSGEANITDWYARVTNNAIRLANALGRAFSNRYDSFWLGLSLSALAVVALLERERYSLFCFGFLLFFVLLHLTPVNFQDRYLISILPLLTLLFLKTLRRFVHLFHSKIVRLLIPATLVLILVWSSYWVTGYRFATALNKSGKGVLSPPILFSGHEEFQKLIIDYNSHLRRSEVIATFHPNILRYLTPEDVRLTNFLLSENVDRSYASLRDQRANYVYVDLKSYRASHMLGLLAKYRSQFVLVSSNKEAAIYKTRFSDLH